jgi:hypothetical protein
MKPRLKKILVVAGLGFGALLAAAQFVPVDYTNPPRRDEPSWDSPETARLARLACYDCHSNETRRPAYAKIAPLSWWIRDHVVAGRAELNFSEAPFREADESAKEIRSGEMPLDSYLWAHPEARLTAAETTALIAGLERTFPHTKKAGAHTDTGD